MKPSLLSIVLLLLASLLPLRAQTADFLLGADVSWSTEMVAKGYSFSSGTGTAGCMQLLRDYGLSAARLRVWVDPANGYNSKADVVQKAKAAAEAGLDLLIDFHFSDTWADPGAQTVPAAWQSATYAQMKEHVAAHVDEVLSALKAEGITPRWVQIGNETNNGMLWDMGKADSNPAQYAGLVAAGSKAAKAVFADVQVIVHVSNGFDQGLFDWNIGIMKKNNVPFDIIGMSLYPGNDENTAETVNKALANISHLYSSFGKRVMIVEVGLPVNAGSAGKTLMADILSRAYALPKQACAGVLYWEPIAPSGWNGYQLGAATASRKVISFTTVMDAFREFSSTLTVRPPLSDTPAPQACHIVGLGGQTQIIPTSGICIVEGTKVLIR